MNQLVAVLRTPLVESLAHALLQFAWQGPVIAALLAAMLHLARRRSPNVRYAMSCGALALMALAPIVTLLVADPPQLRAAAALPASSAAAEPALEVPHWLILGWALGVLLLLSRLCGGIAQTQRWRLDSRTASDTWQRRCEQLAARLGIRKAVEVVTAAHVHVPTVLGWFKPVIAFPAEVLTGLPTAQLESILAHELAHIRRHDALVNLLQSVVETLLFYQPAVWWVSHRIRLEREYCCDDLAIAICGDALAYAHALTALEEQRGTALSLAVSSAGGSLMNRIRRLFGMQALPHRMPARSAIGALLLMGSMVGLSMSLSAATPVAATCDPALAPAAHAGDCNCTNCENHRADHADQHQKAARPHSGQGGSRHQKAHGDGEHSGQAWYVPQQGQKTPSAKRATGETPSSPWQSSSPPQWPQSGDGSKGWWRSAPSAHPFKFEAPAQNGTWPSFPNHGKQQGQYAPTPSTPSTPASPFGMAQPQFQWKHAFPRDDAPFRFAPAQPEVEWKGRFTPQTQFQQNDVTPFRFAPAQPKVEWKGQFTPQTQFQQQQPFKFEWRFPSSPSDDGDAPKDVRPKKATRSAII